MCAAGTYKMIVKPIVVLAFMALMLPNEPDLGMGKRTIVPAGLEGAHVVMLGALDRVQADFNAHGLRRL